MPRPRGRPPATRNVFSFEASGYAPPDRAILDTSFVVDALMSGQAHHAACADALAALSDADTVLAFSSLLDLELIEACYQVALRERWGKQWKQRRPDGRARARAARLADSATSAWSEIVKILNARRVEATVVSAAVPELMRACAVGSYDAVHVATAEHLKIETILTLDTGFARVPQSRLTIHTVASKAPRMRSLR